MKKPFFVATVALAASLWPYLANGAAAMPAAPESAGSIAGRRAQMERKLEAGGVKESLTIRNEAELEKMSEQGATVTVKRFMFAGDLLLPEAQLQRLAEPYLNHEIGMRELNALCADISNAMREQDYAVATAYLPSQDVLNGCVEIRLVGGRYGTIRIHNEAGLSQTVIHDELMGLNQGGFIKTSQLERAALFLDGLSGIRAKAVVTAGKIVGTSDIDFLIEQSGKPVQWQLSYDNYGADSVGPNQTALTGTWDNISGRGDQLQLRLNRGAIRGIGSDGKQGLWLGEISWQGPIGANGGRLQIGYSQMRYALGRSFSDLGFTGSAAIASAKWLIPLQRSRLHSLQASIGVDNAQLCNGYPQPLGDARQTVNRLQLGLQGESSDRTGGSAGNLTWTYGKAALDEKAALIGNNEVAQAAGAYTKLAYSFLRQQRLTDCLTLQLRVNGQLSPKNLVSFEQFSLGGPYGVRAYGVGEGTGGSGYVATSELRWQLPHRKNVQLQFFYDLGTVRINNRNWLGFQGDNRVSLSGYGIGLNWERADLYRLRISYAWPCGSQNSNGSDNAANNGQLWLNATIKL